MKEHDQLAQLWSAVFEHPDDLELRSVLADALQGQGDPRGEFIALQLLPVTQRTRESRERELHLMAELGLKLAFQIPGLRRTLAFTAGLPFAVELRLTDEGVDLPELAVLDRVVVKGVTGQGAMLASKTWRSLTRLEGLTSKCLPLLLESHAPRLQSVLLDEQPNFEQCKLASLVPGLVEFGWHYESREQPRARALEPLSRIHSLVVEVRWLPEIEGEFVGWLRDVLTVRSRIELRTRDDQTDVRYAFSRDMLELTAIANPPGYFGNRLEHFRRVAAAVPRYWPVGRVDVDGREIPEREWRRTK